MKKYFPLLFGAILSLHLFASIFKYESLANFSKPFILLSLLFFILSASKGLVKSSFFKLILAGFAFSLIGDVLLIFQSKGPMFFIGGLGAFLIAHIAYIIAFTKTYRNEHDIALIKRHGWMMLGIFAYAYLFFKGLQDHLGEMIGPVLVYTIAISLMLLLAINRYKRVSDKSFWPIFVGAVLFVASDSLLAWNKFVDPLPLQNLSIMLTYGLAQLGICYGAIFQLKDQAQKGKGN